jgi:hypothetical protein
MQKLMFLLLLGLLVGIVLAQENYAPETNRLGEWLIRALVDYTPQTNNMGSLYFGNMPLETLPNISLQLRGTVRNFGSAAAPSGVPVKVRVDGPQGYVYTDYDQATTVTLNRGQNQIITFTPNWHVPDTMGIYTMKIWTEQSGDEYPGNDTITRTLSVGRWITYANWANQYWITWAGPERSVQFNPSNFGLTYPFQISRLKAQFYLHPSYPWSDSVFSFKIYGDDGTTLLYESDTIRSPGSSTRQTDVTPPAVIPSGTFYVAVASRNFSGYPSSLADDSVQNHSFYGVAGSWIPWTNGELFIAAGVKAGAETKWIGESKPEAIPCLNPDPVVTQLPENDDPDTDTLYYDERTAYTAWIYYGANNGFGLKFKAPANTGVINGALVYLWNASWPTPGGNRFKVRVVDSDGPDGAPGTTLFDTLATGTRGQWNTVQMAVPFTNPNFYIFYVQADTYPACPGLAIDRFDNAPDGIKWQLTGGSGISENEAPISHAKLAVSNFPNPASDIIRLEWQIPQKGNMRIDFFDVTGREVKSLYYNYAETRGSLYVRTEDLANGAYIIRLKNGKETVTTKLVVQK